MSNELKEAAQQVLKELGEARKIVRASSSRQLAKDWDRRATDALANLRTAIQQSEAQQPATPEPVEDGIRNAVDELNCAEEVLDAITCEFSDGEFPVTDFNCIGDYINAVVDVFKERLAAQQPATPDQVVPDSSEHLRVIASLGAALRRLSFAAQTTGGTDGPDAELQSAIGQAEQALSLGGIWQAMSATGEPVLDVRCEGCGYMTHHREHMGCVRSAKQHTNPAPSVTEPVAWLDEMLADTREVFDAGGSETPQVVRDVIEYVKSWVTVYSEKNHPAPAAHPAPSVPGEKPLPDLMMASYHEAIGWNACRAAMLAAKKETP